MRDRRRPLAIRRTLFWLTGPIIAIAVVAFALATHGGPGFFFLSLFTGALLVVGMPLAQLALLALPAFNGRYGAVTFLSLAGMTGLVGALAVSGLFSFW